MTLNDVDKYQQGYTLSEYDLSHKQEPRTLPRVMIDERHGGHRNTHEYQALLLLIRCIPIVFAIFLRSRSISISDGHFSRKTTLRQRCFRFSKNRRPNTRKRLWIHLTIARFRFVVPAAIEGWFIGKVHCSSEHRGVLTIVRTETANFARLEIGERMADIGIPTNTRLSDYDHF